MPPPACDPIHAEQPGQRQFRGLVAATADDDGPSAYGVPALIQPETGAGIAPVPAFGLVARALRVGAFASTVAFADVSGVQLDDHLIGFEGECQLELLGGGWLVQLRAQGLRPLALALPINGFPIYPLRLRIKPRSAAGQKLNQVCGLWYLDCLIF